MGKKRTLASKRRQRTRQKRKKKLLIKRLPTVEASSLQPDQPGDGAVQETLPLDSEDEYDSLGSPGSPPPTPSDMSEPSYLNETFQKKGEEMYEVRHLQEKCKSYKMILAQTHESLHCLRKKLKDQQMEMEDKAFEAKRKVVSIRTFWRDQIFREQSRAGIMIKRAVCKK